MMFGALKNLLSDNCVIIATGKQAFNTLLRTLKKTFGELAEVTF